ncbi:MAG: hypothetical protein EHM14_03130 [Methanothrix sp.]|nr:MAG: hypothetical protein EHM14_03130 [Methanothrix sp.]
MARRDLLQEAKSRFIAELEAQSSVGGSVNLMDEVVVSRPLSAVEAIGDTGRDDFPILRGKEVLMQAVYKDSVGQAFTAAKGGFRGTLGEVLDLPLADAFERAVLVATMNAVLRHLGKVEGTIHCKNDGPKRCAAAMADWIKDQGKNLSKEKSKEQGAKKVWLVGLQPALLEALVCALGPERVLVSDLAEAGSVRCRVKILDGMKAEEIFEQCQIILITGSTLANGTIDDLMEMAEKHECRVVFYGSTIAGAAYLLGLERWCPCSM